MNWETTLSELVKYILPSIVLLLAVYFTLSLTLKSFAKREYIPVRVESLKTTMPLRLAAYERAIIFLERMSPQSLIPRIVTPERISFLKFQSILLNELRTEYEHIISQQIYLSEEAWTFLKNAKEETIALINQSASNLKQDATDLDLSKTIFELMMKENLFPSLKAQAFIRNEVQKLF